MKVAFKALIKQLTVKSLVCGEKEARLLLEFKPKDEDINSLNKLHKPDDLITIVIMDKTK
jgi:hypothetical protein